MGETEKRVNIAKSVKINMRPFGEYTFFTELRCGATHDPAGS
jgi:hypothetical protein